METNEAFPAREMNPADFDKLERYNPKRLKWLAQKWLDQINMQPSKWGLGTVQIKSILGVLGWPFQELIHNLPKVSLPWWKYIFLRAIVHFSTSSLGLFGIYPSSLPKSAGFILGKLHWFLHLMLSYFYNPSMFICCWSSIFVDHVNVYGEWIWANYHGSSFDL